MFVLPAMQPEQTASWLGVLDLYDHLSEGWTLIGGQLVHLRRSPAPESSSGGACPELTDDERRRRADALGAPGRMPARRRSTAQGRAPKTGEPRL
jgi:hypothetical protein